MMLALPTIWILIGLWGGLFWFDAKVSKPPISDWYFFPLVTGLVAYLASVAFFAWRLKGLRWIAAGYSLLNLYFTLFMYALSAMAISGTWL